MNLAQNKFLVGLGGVVLIGAGVLGYLTWNASAKYAEVHEAYQKTSNEYVTLQKLPLFPSEENLKKLEEGKELVNEAAKTLQENLEKLNIPVEPISPEQFQDSLRAIVSTITEKADSSGVVLPEGFYLGFDRYQSQPPKTDLAPLLWRQLKAVELAVNILIESRINAITDLKRQPLPGEDGGSAAPAAAARKPAARGAAAKKKAAAPAAPAVKTVKVSRYPFQISFRSDQPQFRRALNELVSNPKQFFVVQPLLIENEKREPTPRTETHKISALEPAPAISGAGAATSTREREQYVVGTEKVNVVLQLQMVIFGSDQPSNAK